MKLRTRISLYLILFGMVPMLVSFLLNVPMIFDRIEILYHKAHIQNLRAEFGDLDQHLARRHEMTRLLAKMPEPGLFRSLDSGNTVHDLREARKAYVSWVNQVLSDQLDVTQIVFLDEGNQPEFWLDRSNKTGLLEMKSPDKVLVSPTLIEGSMTLHPGDVMNGPIIFDHAASLVSPNRFMQMSLVGPVYIPFVSGSAGQSPKRHGTVIVYIDLGGLASAYRGNYWVLGDGRYLPSASGETRKNSAFDDFPGLQQLFSKGELALWEFGNQQVLWVPLFSTEDDGPLWVGRSVDPSPLDTLQRAVELRLVLIAAGLLVMVFIVARLIAVRLDRLGRELTERIARVLERGEKVIFSWAQPRELRDLGDNLTRLAATHNANTLALRNYAAELEESNRYKSEFLANVSHELRTPLNSILLLSKMLAGGNLSAEQRRQARVINDAGSDLKALIDNILDLSRIEARQMTLVRETVQLRTLVENALELMRPQLDQKHLSLQFGVDDDAPDTIVSDAEKVRQILINFLSNAVKFTSQGGIRVRLHPGGVRDGTNYAVAIEVEDSGIGIAADKLELVFEAFKQADGSTSRRYGGTGLGLTISRELAWLLGGEILVSSEPGAGSVFTLLLPAVITDEPRTASVMPAVAESADRPDASTIPVADYHAARVLLVDDDVRNLLALTPLLESWNLQVMAAGDGHEAIETLMTDGEFALVFMDIMMPEMDGYETIRRIREQPALRDLPVIALTARSGESDLQLCRQAGASNCIVKPIDTLQLKRMLDRYLGDSTDTGDD